MFQSDDFDDMLQEDTLLMIDKALDTADVESSKSVMDNCPELPSSDKSFNEEIVKKRTHPDRENPKRKKRKFPGPAGLLPDNAHDSVLDSSVIVHSQSFNLSQNQFLPSIFEEGPWNVMMDEMRLYGYLPSKYSISTVEAQANKHKLIGQRVPFLVGVVQNIDRSLQDPFVVLRDSTGEINGTIHRDVWETYGPYLVPQFSVIFLRDVSILTTGMVVKKNYLNITLNNVVIVCCDEENSYTTREQKLSLKSDIISKRFKLIKVKWNSVDIVVLRSNVVGSESMKNTSEGGGSITSAKCGSSKEHMPEESIAQTLLSGINADAFFDDFN